ncbi:hypothetical protein VTJ83DRAFT_2407 [Remersonia thermophila]|uniref:Cystathionine gamma-synthase n=1 Tax=Remersonia thermophila TaxID=72144 RepID=A0ABR4DIM3_9PEZI
MPVKKIDTAFGHSLPPEAPHNITFHIPGWETARALRRGEKYVYDRLDSIYPRFGPWREVKELANVLHPLFSLPESHSLILFPSPAIVPAAVAFAASPSRKPEHRVHPHELLFRAVDLPLTLPLPSEPQADLDPLAHPGRGGGGDVHAHGAVVRLYAVAYPTDRAPGALGVWQNYGVGISSRLAAALLPAARDGRARVLGWSATAAEDAAPALEAIPQATHLPLGPAHEALRRRVAGLAGGKGGAVRPEDVWLYPTGMGAVYRASQALHEVRGHGTVAVLGSVFHSSWALFGEGQGGMKHFGRCGGDSRVIEELDEWLEGERQAGRKTAFIFAEFPCNPILVSVDLVRLKQVADKYDVPVVLDETIGSFCNIDVSHLADVIITSITKSLSGYANVMGGAVSIPPSSRCYAAITAALRARFRNEYFHADALKLLANSADYHARSAVLNRNALALASWLAREHVARAESPVVGVLYPPFTDSAASFAAVMREPYKVQARTSWESLLRPSEAAATDGTTTAAAAATTTTTSSSSSTTTAATKANDNDDDEEEEVLFQPGHGCLLAVEFTSIRVAIAFYDHLSVFHGPHLGAHHTLAFPFNDAIWISAPQEFKDYLRSFGARGEQVRISVGLEDEETLIDTFKAALDKAEEEWRAELREKEERDEEAAGAAGAAGAASSSS